MSIFFVVFSTLIGSFLLYLGDPISVAIGICNLICAIIFGYLTYDDYK